MFVELFRLNLSTKLVHVKILLIAWLSLFFFSKHIYCAISQSGQTILQFFFNRTEGMGQIVTRSCWKESCLSQHFSQKNHTENCTLTQQLSSSALQRWRSTDLHFEKAAVKISQAIAECKRGGIKQHLSKLRSTEIQNTIKSSIWPFLQNHRLIFWGGEVSSNFPTDRNIPYAFIHKNMHKDSCAIVTPAINRHPVNC